MAYPTAPTNPIPTIATDTNYSAPGDDWDGLPTKVAPSVAVETQGYVPGDERPADYDNYLFATMSEWDQYLSDFCDELKLQKVQGPASSTDNAVARFDSTTGKIIQNSALICADTTGELTYGTGISRTIRISFAAGAPNHTGGAADWASLDRTWFSLVNSGTIHIDMRERLPLGATVTSITVEIIPGAARAGVNRMNVSTHVAGDNQNSYDDGTTNSQTVTKSMSIAMSSETTVAYVTVVAGNTGAASPDTINYVAITYTDPGPSAR